ncbi:MAG: alanine/glycine:cation symporter family protein [Saprospiraceae bacterium]|nr:alanine/glycine:cation symporter family protein [Saprospiraceae bacterium]|tara:strand:+ start:877 stop:2262 length:1386 start_codon:yes stop_codon:yes gene_type:complete
MSQIDQLISDFASFVWGFPLLILLVGGGLFLLFMSKMISFRYLFHSINILRGKYDDEQSEGEISHFAALTTALSSTIGMGNIAGVAVAITIGGPGAIFWMWVSGLIGMCTKFFTCTLSILYRGKDSAGRVQGGPMYFIVEGLGKKWKPLAIFFSLAGLIGALPVFNVNQLTQAVGDILLAPQGIEVTTSVNATIGIILILITCVVIFGGIKRISDTATKLVPTMVVLYFLLVVVILIANYEQVPHYLSLIITDAFAAEHYSGDPLLGGMLGGLILLGIRRGAFSNEAGIGTAPMAHGAAKTNEPIREGLVAMLGPAIDTLVVCTLTALAILVTDTWLTSDSNGVSLTASAFSDVFHGFGPYLLLLCVAVFSISSLFSFSYYGTKCLSFLIGADKAHWYNYFYIASIMIGATFSLDAIINLIDGFYALMAFPTMIATILLSKKVLAKAKDYFRRMQAQKELK